MSTYILEEVSTLTLEAMCAHQCYRSLRSLASTHDSDSDLQLNEPIWISASQTCVDQVWLMVNVSLTRDIWRFVEDSTSHLDS